MPSDVTTPEQPNRRSVGDPEGAASADAPLTRRQLREMAAAKAARRSADSVPSVPVSEAVDPAEDASPRLPAQPVDGVAGEQAVDDTVEEQTARADAFAAAAMALNFTGETPLVARPRAARRSASQGAPRDVVRHDRRARRMMTTAAASLSAMAAVGLLAFGLTTPLGAMLGGDDASMTSAAALSSASGASSDEEIQAFVAADDASAPSLDRIDDYEAASFSDMAESAGINTAGAFFVNDPTADIQWPFSVGTGMSYGYGMRSGRMHQGIDFTPGNGAPIQAIADGTVRIATESGGGYGVHVYIDHVIDGQAVTSHYAHMQYGSLRVTAGQKVEVGDVIGLVGDTGHSFGAHAHFELLKGGATFDPLPWLEKYAGTHLKDDASDDEDVDFASEDGE